MSGCPLASAKLRLGSIALTLQFSEPSIFANPVTSRLPDDAGLAPCNERTPMSGRVGRRHRRGIEPRTRGLRGVC